MNSDNDVTWYIGNHLLLDVVAPKDYADPSSPVAVGGAVNGVDSVLARVFDKRVKSVLTQDEVATALTIIPESVDGLAVGDTITIEESNGSFTRHPVTIIDTDTKLVTFTTGLTVGAKAGARYWKTYGTGEVVGVGYGTPSVTESDWGYVFDISYTYDADLRRDLRLEAMVIVHLSSTGAHYTRAWDVIMAEALGNP